MGPGLLPRRPSGRHHHGINSIESVPKVSGTRVKTGVRAASRAKKISKFVFDAGPFNYTITRSVTDAFPATVTVCAPVYSKRTE